MKASKKTVLRKRPGRPATGQDPVTAIRLSKEMRAAIDAWAAAQDDEPARSEAIRRLREVRCLARTPIVVMVHDEWESSQVPEADGFLLLPVTAAGMREVFDLIPPDGAFASAS